MVVMVRRLVVVECSFDNSQGYAYNQRAAEEEDDSHDNDAYFEASLLASTLHCRGVWLIGIFNSMARLIQRRGRRLGCQRRQVSWRRRRRYGLQGHHLDFSSLGV